MSGTDLPMSVGNVGFMIDRLGQDCAPLQYIRELTQNSVQAIKATPSGKGEIIWDIDPLIFEDTGVEKLRIIDTGVGMTGSEMIEYINKAFSSIYEQGYDANFGVGAKVAAATRNKVGLVYLSWKAGEGSMIHLRRNPDTGQYGLLQFKQPDGTYAHWAKVDDVVKPDIINGHGTVVILLGDSDEENTFQMPEGARLASSEWIAHYLNSRYFTLSEDITIKARGQNWENSNDGKMIRRTRTITGQKEALDKNAESSGKVELDGATAHWWITKVRSGRDTSPKSSSTRNTTGHTAALFQDELYEMMTLGKGGAPRLQSFGIYVGFNRVVLYIEPHSNEKQKVIPNTPRTHLLLNNESLPWSQWATEFRDNMPNQIKKLIESVLAKSSIRSDDESIDKRIKELERLYTISRYRPNPKGENMVDDPTLGGSPQERGDKQEKNGKGGGKGGLAGRVYSWFQKDEGAKANKVKGAKVNRPTVKWVTSFDESRVPPDLEDRAARFIPETNQLFINADFRGFVDTIRHLTEDHRQLEKVPGGKIQIKRLTRLEFEGALVETVLSLQSLEGSREWSNAQLRDALSEEGLTAAVMPRYHIYHAVSAQLRKMGSKAA